MSSRAIAYSEILGQETVDLLDLLRERYYGSPEVTARDREAEELLRSLFNALLARPDEAPERFKLPSEPVELAIASYIASLTDMAAATLAKRLA